MSLGPSIVGLESAAHELAYDWKTTVLYALGIGAKRDELDYLYEGRGPKVFPTFAVVPTYAPIIELLGKTGGDVRAMVHGSQTITLERPIPPSGTFVTRARVSGVYDMKRLAQVVCSTESRIAGELVCTSEWMLLFRNEGGFGGPRPPKAEVPKVEGDPPPAFRCTETVSPEQALLYRLSGDPNPLHADPEFARAVGFEQGPILHGLATYGFIARAIVKHALGGDGSRLRSFGAAFKKPVWPGETLETVGHLVGSNVVAKAYAGGREDPVVSNCYATFV
ncbi:MAG TPA: MaoC/PaaZ C-terminal domain-containing protein [Polyangiaceae bacterium]|nr:MaoC/PaaZ C-terminal domain-containing protein [Polyangiaceae bacterium]